MIDIAKIRELSKRETDEHQVPLMARAGKLSEETGELWQEVLAYEGIVNASASANGNVEDVAEETVDVLINCFDILAMLGLSDAQINLVLRQKTAKWERKLGHA